MKKEEETLPSPIVDGGNKDDRYVFRFYARTNARNR